MVTLTFYLAVFLVISVVFLFIHLMMGKVIRPSRPDAEKQTIYECGEPTVGSAWIQFDLRYYVVALLFVIFDVEVAFFFPWAITFGKVNDLSRSDMDPDQRAAISRQLVPPGQPLLPGEENPMPVSASVAENLAWIAMADILVFFGVLLVGYAYLWKRGDIDWVRTVVAERAAAPPEPEPIFPKPQAGAMASAGR